MSLEFHQEHSTRAFLGRAHGRAHISTDMASAAPIQVTVLNSSRKTDKDDRARSVDFVGAFSTQKGKQLDVAKRSSKLKRIVKITIANGDSEYKRKGQAVHVKTFPLLEDQRQLSNYGCPVAVSLFLRFQTECAILFVLMAIVAGPQLADNYNRSQARMDCRRSVALNESAWDAVTARASANASYPAEYSRCGWNGLPIQRNLSTTAGYLAWSVGACQEFTTSAESFQPISASPDGTPKYVRTTAANYCQQETGGLLAASYWLQFVNVILFFGFLVRIRRFQRDAGVRFDRALWTAADYTVLLKGLDRHVPADARSAQIRDRALQTSRPEDAVGLEGHLYRDLAERGFTASDIVKIELGRECKRDVVALGSLKKLRVREQELTAQAQWRTQHGKPAMGVKMQAEWDKLQESKAEVLQELETARHAADYTTGHAFVTFYYERRRNDLVRACRPKTCLNLLRFPSGRSMQVLTTAPPSPHRYGRAAPRHVSTCCARGWAFLLCPSPGRRPRGVATWSSKQPRSRMTSSGRISGWTKPSERSKRPRPSVRRSASS